MKDDHLIQSQKTEIRLAHGSGGNLSHRLIEEIFLPIFGNPILNTLDDSAVIDVPRSRMAFTTDSFVVSPLFFPGGDIGRLAVCGTVNDLSVMGAKPLYISMGFILEEGFPVEDLKQIVHSAKNTADEAGVLIVTGDTKVVEKGKGDGVYINTSGIGVLRKGTAISGSNAKVGDRIVVNGFLGCHGMAVVTARGNLGFQSAIQSDVAPLNRLVEVMLDETRQIHAMRDATRGGLASVLNEIALQSGVGIELIEKRIPVNDEVRGGCELLGFDPLYLANEGVLVACVSAGEADRVISRMKKTRYGESSSIIGSVVAEPKDRVILKTMLGSHKIVALLSGEQLPRIC